MAIDMNIRITEDRKKTILTFSPESGVTGELELNQLELANLISALGSVRWTMAEGQKIAEITGAKIQPAYQTKWAVQKDTLKEETLLAFQHPGYGPVGFVLSDKQIKEYIKALQKGLKIKKPTTLKKNV